MAGDVATELAALRRITNTLDALDEPTRARTMRWLHDRYDQVPVDDHVPDFTETRRYIGTDKEA